MVVVRCLLLLQLFTVYPLIAMIWRDASFNIFKMGNPDRSMWRKLLYNIGLLFICALLAIMLPSISSVITVFGSVCGFLLIYFAPCLCAWADMRMDGADPNLPPIPRRRFYAKSFAFFVIGTCGALNLGANLYDFTRHYVDNFEATSGDSSAGTELLQINPRFYMYTS